MSASGKPTTTEPESPKRTDGFRVIGDVVLPTPLVGALVGVLLGIGGMKGSDILGRSGGVVVEEHAQASQFPPATPPDLNRLFERINDHDVLLGRIDERLKNIDKKVDDVLTEVRTRRR